MIGKHVDGRHCFQYSTHRQYWQFAALNCTNVSQNHGTPVFDQQPRQSTGIGNSGAGQLNMCPGVGDDHRTFDAAPSEFTFGDEAGVGPIGQWVCDPHCDAIFGVVHVYVAESSTDHVIDENATGNGGRGGAIGGETHVVVLQMEIASVCCTGVELYFDRIDNGHVICVIGEGRVVIDGLLKVGGHVFLQTKDDVCGGNVEFVDGVVVIMGNGQQPVLLFSQSSLLFHRVCQRLHLIRRFNFVVVVESNLLIVIIFLP